MKPVTDTNQITRLVLRGYKSIAECEIELGRINVLIGANGVGEPNFIGFFHLINRILDQQLQLTASEMGGPKRLAFALFIEGEPIGLGLAPKDRTFLKDNDYCAALETLGNGGLKCWRHSANC